MWKYWNFKMSPNVQEFINESKDGGNFNILYSLDRFDCDNNFQENSVINDGISTL